MRKITVAILFGGRSSEHEVSLMTAATMISALDSEKYQVIPVGITKEGRWMIYNGSVERIPTGEWEKYSTPVLLSPDAGEKCLLKLVNGRYKEIAVDVVVPALHGAWGEDGTVQGLLEMAGIPYVGCGVLASAVSMDKVFTKIVTKSMRIPSPKYLWFLAGEWKKKQKSLSEKVEKQLGYPCFVKPANAGSSVGISKAENREQLEKAVALATKYDRKVIVEEGIKGRELECAVLGNEELRISGVGEVVAAAEFYDYEAKYHNASSKTVVPAEVDESVVQEVRRLAEKVYRAVDGAGLARVDFFLEEESGKVLFNELNTMPGFTAISMYPMLWEEQGMTKPELMDCLITLALERDNGIRGTIEGAKEGVE